MKTNTLLLKTLLLSVFIFLGTASFAGNSETHPELEKIKNSRLYKHLFERHSLSNGELNATLSKSNSYKVEKSSQKNRLAAVAFQYYDAITFTIEDSIQFFWSDNANHKEIVKYLLNDFFEIPQDLNDEFSNPNLHKYALENSSYIINTDSMNVHWINSNNQLEHSSSTIMDFDSSGNVISQTHLSFNGSTWDTNYRETYTYDANSNLTSIYSENWSSGNWVDDNYVGFKYDANDLIIEIVDAYYTGSFLDSNYKDIFSYNSNGQLIVQETHYWSSNTWRNEYKDTIIYDAQNLISEVISKEWDGSSWDISEVYDFKTNSFHLIDTIVLKEPNGNAYDTVAYAILTYDSLANNTSLSLEFDFGNAWFPLLVQNFDYQGTNLTEYTTSYFNFDSLSLINDSRYLYHYNNDDDLTLIEYQEWDSTWIYNTYGGYPVKGFFYYESYTDTTITAINSPIISAEFNLYPNPTSETLNIKANNAVSHLRVSDISGKAIFETKSNFRASELNIPVGHLPNGIYFIEIESNGQKGTKKFIVQH